MSINDAIERIYSTYDGPGVNLGYHDRHGTASLNVLTVTTPEQARVVVSGEFLDAIRGRVVVEVGAGVGLLSLEMARHAKQVYAIEVDPAWSWTFTKYLYGVKPPNLTWIFGSAETVADVIRAEVAVIRTRSGVRTMVSLAERMAPTIILSACEQPLIAPRGEQFLRAISEWIDERVAKMQDEIASAVQVLT